MITCGRGGLTIFENNCARPYFQISTASLHRIGCACEINGNHIVPTVEFRFEYLQRDTTKVVDGGEVAYKMNDEGTKYTQRQNFLEGGW
jgi:hypothetical protein